MKPIPLVFAALIAASAHSLHAQQLQQPSVPAAKPVVAPRNSGVGPQLQQVPMQPQAIASDPSQRPLSASPVRSTGPAQGVPTGADARTLQKGRPASVLDASGKPVNGMIQVAPNRVYDPNSGRYHWTDTSGQQQKLRD